MTDPVEDESDAWLALTDGDADMPRSAIPIPDEDTV